MKRFSQATLAALLASGLALPAAAQPSQPQPPGAAADTARPGRDARQAKKGAQMHQFRQGDAAHPRHGMLAMMAQHTKGIMAFYRAELAITPAQEPQWTAFAAVLGDAIVARHAAATKKEAMPDAATAPERMDAEVAALTAALDTAKALAGTGKALYAVLTPEQRLLADKFWARPMDMPMP
jgi:hypothetical protein